MKKILIVDDEVKIRRLVEVTLRKEDREIMMAETGINAVKIARREKPDLILMDIMMPGVMDGLEATRILKKDPETKGCTIILLTARGQNEDRQKGFEAGADDYFSKPFSPKVLIEKIEEIFASQLSCNG
jgi:two-component system, OmpR family, phosphate regulon response regulator PhoB